MKVRQNYSYLVTLKGYSPMVVVAPDETAAVERARRIVNDSTALVVSAKRRK